MSGPQNPRVTQADRDAAAAYMAHFRPAGWRNAVAQIPRGNADLGESVQAFARHREAAEAASKAREAALVEALTMFVECARYQPHMGGNHSFMGWNQSGLRRAESHARATLAALTKEPDA